LLLAELWGRSLILIGRHVKNFIAVEALFEEKGGFPEKNWR